MKKVLAVAVILCLVLVGCNKPDADSSGTASDTSTVAVSSVDSGMGSSDLTSEIASTDSQSAEESSEGQPAVSSKPAASSSKPSTSKPSSSKPSSSSSSTSSNPASPYPVYTEGDMEYTRFSAFEKSTQAQLDSMIKSNLKMTVCKEKAHIPTGATASIKLEYTKQEGWAQMLDMKESTNGAGAKNVDPFPIPLGDYEGIRFWIEVVPQQPTSFTTLGVIVGDWGYGYRTMYQKDVTLTQQGFKGYIEIPFDELADFYGSPSSADPDNMDFIAFKFTRGTEGCQTNVNIYISDVQAYRSL